MRKFTKLFIITLHPIVQANHIYYPLKYIHVCYHTYMLFKSGAWVIRNSVAVSGYILS